MQETFTKIRGGAKHLILSCSFAITFFLSSSSFNSYNFRWSVGLLTFSGTCSRHLCTFLSPIEVCDFARLLLNALHIELHLKLSHNNNHILSQLTTLDDFWILSLQPHASHESFALEKPKKHSGNGLQEICTYSCFLRILLQAHLPHLFHFLCVQC